ncbi:MAG: DUF721 domain-containing protein [Pseudomonadota bacterium]
MQQLVSENLGALAKRAGEMDQLTQIVRAVLPNPLGDHIIAVNVRNETVFVVADSPVWASRIRFYSQEILDKVETTHPDPVGNLAVKVRAPQVPDH